MISACRVSYLIIHISTTYSIETTICGQLIMEDINAVLAFKAKVEHSFAVFLACLHRTHQNNPCAKPAELLEPSIFSSTYRLKPQTQFIFTVTLHAIILELFIKIIFNSDIKSTISELQ